MTDYENLIVLIDGRPEGALYVRRPVIGDWHVNESRPRKQWIYRLPAKKAEVDGHVGLYL